MSMNGTPAGHQRCNGAQEQELQPCENQVIVQRMKMV